MNRLLPLALALTFAAPAHAGAADTVPPTISEISGTLTAAGPRHGVAWLTFNAADAGWLRRAVLSVDGDERSVRLEGASAAAVELTWDTAAVHDGVHVVSAKVEDTDGNAAFAFGPAVVTTDNEPPVAGSVAVTRSAQTLVASPSGFDGQDVEYAYRWQRCDPGCEAIDGATHARYVLTAADADQVVRAVVTATDLGGATIARSPQVAIGPVTVAAATPVPIESAAPTRPAPIESPTPAAAFAEPRPLAMPFTATPRSLVVLAWRTLRANYGERVEIAGRVADAGGRPLAGATLDVRAKLRVPGATERREGGVGSARDGRFSYVAPAGASRDLRIGTATVTLLVRAAGSFTASRHGALVRFSGRVRGGHLPRGGVLVEIRAGTRVIALVRTDGHGAYRATRRATRQSFRARTRADSSWPFVAAPVGSPVSA